MSNKDSRGDKALSDEIRKAGYTIAEFCKETGISKAALYEYMAGAKEPTASKLLIMSKTLKIPLKGIFEMLGFEIAGVPDDQ
ncbi:helix-turn-helix domain-containing protein [Picosynechococcus sp. PCC 73109]|uniref:helix-turn-helix domain-containing protein n=1 Tax=Picosynechococcus sp. PCC 73109 TaxID=374982 RepID=UPI0007459219|nr:helix-turn-helix transcriptional regulator [Picosynechococcus sp. PCC 73109]AMA07902.1 hypothetical protein AWQ23_00415 [Picosynechococcus sp. PCC 73109]